jgi:surface protein
MLTATMQQDTSSQSTWLTTNAGSASTTIVVPTSSTGTYGCTVDWGDGTTSNISTFSDAAWTHVYGSSGTYTVKIYGTFNGIFFDNTGDKLKILTITKWGCNFRLGTNQGLYYDGCTNLTISATDALILNGTTSLASAFQTCTSIATIPNINSWDVSQVTSLASTFSGCSLFNQSINSWNVANVTLMSSLFSNATLYNQSMSSWNVSNVTTMNSMFRGTTYTQSLNAWNIANVTNLGSIFSRSSTGAGANPPCGSWVTSSVTVMSSLASDNTSFNQNIGGWNTANVTTFASAFLSASSFNQALAWNTAKVTNMSSMFNGATAFNQDVSAWSIAALTNATTMFTSSGFSMTNYNLLLSNTAGWPSQATIQTGVVFSAGSAHYGGASAIAGRAILTGTFAWSITDGGTP